MKKYVFIILSLLFVSFAYANANPVKAKKMTGAGLTQHTPTVSHTPTSYPNEDVELSIFNGGHNIQAYHSVQKDITCTFNYPIAIPLSAKKPLATSYANPQLFNNSCLYYNYPSHNFW